MKCFVVTLLRRGWVIRDLHAALGPGALHWANAVAGQLERQLSAPAAAAQHCAGLHPRTAGEAAATGHSDDGLLVEICTIARDLNLRHLQLIDPARCPYDQDPWRQMGGCDPSTTSL